MPHHELMNLESRVTRKIKLCRIHVSNDFKNKNDDKNQKLSSRKLSGRFIELFNYYQKCLAL